MSFVTDDLDSINTVFISIDELFQILSEVDSADYQSLAQWLMRHNIPQQSKSLILIDDYLLKECEDIESTSSSIKIINDIAKGSTMGIDDFPNVGFARKVILTLIKQNGLSIPLELIDESNYYIPIHGDNNFYQVQTTALIAELDRYKQIARTKIEKKENGTIADTLAQMMTKGSPNYSPNVATYAWLQHRINLTNDWRNTNRQRAIRDLLDECPHKGTISGDIDYHTKFLSATIIRFSDQKEHLDIAIKTIYSEV